MHTKKPKIGQKSLRSPLTPRRIVDLVNFQSSSTLCSPYFTSARPLGSAEMMVPRGYSYVANSYEEKKQHERKKNVRNDGGDRVPTQSPNGSRSPESLRKVERQSAARPDRTRADSLARSSKCDRSERRDDGSSKSESPWLGMSALDSRHSPVFVNRQATSHRLAPETTSFPTRRKPVSSSSPKSWGMLLTPPEEMEVEIGSIGSDTTLDGSSFIRSMSRESMSSMDDDDSTSSTSSEGPADKRKSSVSDEKRHHWLSTSLPEDCRSDHPLLSPIVEAKLELDMADGQTRIPVATARMSKFKSNLTASLRAISSAAKSFSNLTAPALRQDEYLTRSLLSISSQITDERRPVLPDRLPDPALRRYLNPVPSTMSAAEFHAYRNEARRARESSGLWKASVQLQPYARRPSVSDVATSPPIFMSSPSASSLDEASVTTMAPRQREPRENSDFLRVIVLEMNMRRNGRLKEAEPGRARLWLPARQSCDVNAKKESRGGQIPRRWMSVDA